MPPPAPVRRTRIVCIADTHNSTVKLPKGDVLIHAGDLTNQGSYAELVRAVAWLEKADFECKIVVAGNHDLTLDEAFYAQHGGAFHNQAPQSTDACRALLERSATITYLRHGSATVRLQGRTGPHTRFAVFGSPYSPRSGGTWAFSYPPAEDSIWSAVPDDADIVITHTPPFGHCDWSATRGQSLGCPGLWHALQRVRPRLAVCGHVHEGRGAERLRWDTAAATTVERWEDPGAGAGTSTDTGTGTGSGRMSIVDLTARAGKRDLDRAETCIVNCAITATNYPHAGGKRLNKPIVVDLDLPVWEEGRPDGRQDSPEGCHTRDAVVEPRMARWR